MSETVTKETAEEARVRVWTERQLVRLGCDEYAACQASFAHVDWHAVEALIDRGCTPDLALEIVI